MTWTKSVNCPWLNSWIAFSLRSCAAGYVAELDGVPVEITTATDAALLCCDGCDSILHGSSPQDFQITTSLLAATLEYLESGARGPLEVEEVGKDKVKATPTVFIRVGFQIWALETASGCSFIYLVGFF